MNKQYIVQPQSGDSFVSLLKKMNYLQEIVLGLSTDCILDCLDYFSYSNDLTSLDQQDLIGRQCLLSKTMLVNNPIKYRL